MHTVGLEDDQVVHALRGIGESVDARNYSSLAALIFLFLHYLYCIRNEFNYIWRLPPYRLSEGLYVIARYFPLAVQTTSYVFVHVFLVHSPVSVSHCKLWFSLLGTTTDVLSGVMDIIFLLRVFALYKRSHWVLILSLPFLFIKHVLAQVLLLEIAFGDPSFNEYCDLQQTPLMSVPLGVLTLACHGGLWYAIYAKRKVSDTVLLSTVVKESHWVFALFLVPTLVTIPLSYRASPNPFILFVWPITFISITLCHILLEVSHLKAKIARLAGRRRPGMGASTTDFLFSTILEFDGLGHDIESRASEISLDHAAGNAGAGAGINIHVHVEQIQSDSKA